MQETLFPGCGESSFAFITNAAFGSVNTHDPDADRVAAAASKLDRLVAEIVDHPVYLLDHRFCQNLYFRSDFDGGNRASSHNKAGIEPRGLPRYDLAERSVPAPGSYTSPSVPEVQNPVMPRHCRYEL